MKPLPGDVVDILNHFDAQEAVESTLLKQVSRPPARFHLTTLLVMVWGVLMMAISVMAVIKLPHPILYLMDHKTILIPYTLQIPVAILVGAVMGRKFGTITLLLYVIAGLAGFPVFAGGGGWQYYLSLSFGYILGFLLIPQTVEGLQVNAYKNTQWLRGRSLWILMAAGAGVLVVHGAGLVILGLHALIQQFTMPEFQHWISVYTWPGILYDFLFSLIAVGAVRLFRILFWFCLY